MSVSNGLLVARIKTVSFRVLKVTKKRIYPLGFYSIVKEICGSIELRKLRKVGTAFFFDREINYHLKVMGYLTVTKFDCHFKLDFSPLT